MEAFFPEYIKVENIKYHKKSKKIQIYLTSKDFIKQEILDEKVRIISEKFEIDDVEIIPQYVVSQEEKEKLSCASQPNKAGSCHENHRRRPASTVGPRGPPRRGRRPSAARRRRRCARPPR